MALLNFRRLVTREQETAAVISGLVAVLGAAVQIEDADGTPLVGAAQNGVMRYPVQVEGDTVGWVAGDARAATVAQWLTYIVQRVWERKNLAHEALEKYRELNLLYELTEKVSATLDAPAVAQIGVAEARRLIPASGGAMLLRDEATGVLDALDATADALLGACGQSGAGIIGAVAGSGKAEVVNDITGDSRADEAERALVALLAAPLIAKQRVLGVLVLGSATPLTYTAADLKLLKAIAALAAPALDNALTHATLMREAAAREAQLRKQIAELHIQVDKTKQARQVADITGTEYFEMLRSRAKDLRRK